MAKILFPPISASMPLVPGQELSDFRLGSGTSYASLTVNTEHRSAWTVEDSAYVCRDHEGLYSGNNNVTVRATIRLDFAAASGQICTILSRGENGVTADLYWSWTIQLDVVSSTEATIQIAWQRGSDGILQTLDLGILTPPADPLDWQQLTVTRERTNTGHEYRSYLDGVLLATASSAEEPSLTPSAEITVLGRNNNGIFDNFFFGDITEIVLDFNSTTELKEQLAADYFEYVRYQVDVMRGLLPQCDVLELNNSIYDAYRLQVMAQSLGYGAMEARRRDEALLPPNSYDEALDLWEKSLALKPGSLTIAERQTRAQNFTALVDGLSSSVMKSYADTILGISSIILTCPSDIIYDLSDIVTFPYNATTRDQIAGHRVNGNITATWTGTQLDYAAADATFHTYVNYADEQSGLSEVCLHDGKIALYVRMQYPVAPVVTSTEITGITARLGLDCHWFAIDNASNQIAHRERDGTYTLLSAVPVSASRTYDFVLLQTTDDWSGSLLLRVKAAEDTDYVEETIAFSAKPLWYGIGVVTDPAGTQVAVFPTIHIFRALDPLILAGWVATGSFARDPIEASQELDRKNRASSRATASVDSEFELGSTDSVLGATPLMCPQ